MKIKIQLFFFLLLSAMLAGANASTPTDSTFCTMRDTTAFKTKLKAFSSSFTGMECEFSQVKKMKMLKKPVVSHGFFYYKNGKQVRWE
jgi:outer membrane lipoprotein-sorting protein